MHMLLMAGVITLTSCRTASHQTTFKLKSVTGSKTEMTSDYDLNPNAKIVETLAPYKEKVDEVMKPVIGQSEEYMYSSRPESLLSNLIADVLRQSAVAHIGRPADMALMNMGGIRSSLSEGDITFGDIAQILPFENFLCLVTMQGTDLKELMTNIASAKGEGVSNVRLEITKDGKLVDATIGGQPIEDNKQYVVATLDYLAEGNDKMVALKKAVKKDCFADQTVRDIFLKYVAGLAAQNQKVSSKIDGRIIIK